MINVHPPKLFTLQCASYSDVFDDSDRKVAFWMLMIAVCALELYEH